MPESRQGRDVQSQGVLNAMVYGKSSLYLQIANLTARKLELGREITYAQGHVMHMQSIVSLIPH